MATTLLRPGRTRTLFPSRIYNPELSDTYLHQCFEVLKVIGEGCFGVVYRVRSREDANLYAVKRSRVELRRNTNHRKQAENEIHYHHELSGHPNIVTLYQAWEEEDYFYIQLELCEESLEDYAGSINDAMVRHVLFAISSALKYVHENGFIHFDVKLSNILIDGDGMCKLADFGLIKKVNESLNDWDEVDSRYLAPEVLGGHFTQAADIFGLGVSMLEFACQTIILSNRGLNWQELREIRIPHRLRTKVSDQVAGIIVAMMDRNYQSRPTAHQVLEELVIEHEEEETCEPLPCESLPEQKITCFGRFYSCLENLFSWGYHTTMDTLFGVWNSLWYLLLARRNATPINLVPASTDTPRAVIPRINSRRRLAFNLSDENDDSN